MPPKTLNLTKNKEAKTSQSSGKRTQASSSSKPASKKSKTLPASREIVVADPNAPRPDPFAPKEIDFTAPFTLTGPASPIFRKFKSSKMEPMLTCYPDQTEFERLGIYEEVKSLLCDSGLSILYEEDLGTSKRLSLEFIPTFEPVFVDEDGIIDELATVGGVRRQRSSGTLVRWDFQLGGQKFEVPIELIAEWLKFPINGKREKSSPEERDKFWRKITKTNEYFVTHQTSNRIKLPVWRVIHKIVAESFIVRKDGPRFVTKADIDVLILISKHEAVNWLGLLTDLFLEHQNPKSTIKSIGGGSFITLIASKCGFNVLDGTRLKKSLDSAAIIEAKILNERRKLIVEDFPSARVSRLMVQRHNKDRSKKGKWVHPWEEATSGSRASKTPPFASKIMSRIDALGAAHTSHSAAQNAWLEDKFSTIFTHLSLGGVTPGPSFPWPPTNDDEAEATEEDGSESEEEESSEEDDASGDDE